VVNLYDPPEIPQGYSGGVTMCHDEGKNSEKRLQGHPVEEVWMVYRKNLLEGISKIHARNWIRHLENLHITIPKVIKGHSLNEDRNNKPFRDLYLFYDCHNQETIYKISTK